MNKDNVLKIVENEVVKNNTTDVEWRGETIKVNYMIDFYMAEAIVDSVVAGCFDADGMYNPNNMELALRSLIVMAYTDVELPDDNTAKYAFLFGTDIFQIVVENANSDQLGEIRRLIDEKVEYVKKMNADALMNKMLDLHTTISSIVEQLGRMAEGVSPDDISKLVGAISESKFDEGKLAKAIVEERTAE